MSTLPSCENLMSWVPVPTVIQFTPPFPTFSLSLSPGSKLGLIAPWVQSPGGYTSPLAAATYTQRPLPKGLTGALKAASRVL